MNCFFQLLTPFVCVCFQVLWGSRTWHQKKNAFLCQWLHRCISHSGLVGHFVYLPGNCDKRHHFWWSAGGCYGKHAGQTWAFYQLCFSIHALNCSLTAPLRVCRVCWRVFLAQRSQAGCSVCSLASLSPSSAAPVLFWCLNGCSSTSASTFCIFSVCQTPNC